MRHELKCWAEYFDAVKSGEKAFEFRKDDRNFSVGDVLVLHKFDPGTRKFMGEVLTRKVSYIARGSLIPEGFCVMSIEEVKNERNKTRR
jgi:ASC-1-like (ASCH) protein